MAAEYYPPCFPDAEQFQAWNVASEELEGDVPISHSYCWDCTPAYRDRMVDEGRCYFPETYFVPCSDISCDEGEMYLVGIRPWV